MFTHTRSDYQRHGNSLLHPEFWLISNYRFGRWVNTITFRPLRWFLSKIYGIHRLLFIITTGDILDREVEIGDDFHIIHAGCIKIHSHSKIGNKVGIMHGVTLGTNTERGGAPTICDNVFIGTGAVILGNITVGEGARVAANSLVISNVPAGATAIGVPARNIKYTGRENQQTDG